MSAIIVVISGGVSFQWGFWKDWEARGGVGGLGDAAGI